MPQLDQFPILFQFKSFIVIFVFFYFIFLLVVLPLIHVSMRLRKMSLVFLLIMTLLYERDIFRIFFILSKFFKFFYYNYNKVVDVFFNLVYKKIKFYEIK
jgi:hypothetical protein